MECCRYGNWIAPSTTPMLSQPHATADTVHLLSAGDTIAALRGHELLTSPGVVVFAQADTLRALPVDSGQADWRSIPFARGDTVLTLHFGGEATDILFWFSGSRYTTGDLQAFGLHDPTPEEPYQVIRLPISQWWVEARASGKQGWIRDPFSFRGAGDCR